MCCKLFLIINSLLILLCPNEFTTSSLVKQRTSFALAFELPGGWLKEKDAMTLTVLQVSCFNIDYRLIMFLNWVQMILCTPLLLPDFLVIATDNKPY